MNIKVLPFWFGQALLGSEGLTNCTDNIDQQGAEAITGLLIVSAVIAFIGVLLGLTIYARRKKTVFLLLAILLTSAVLPGLHRTDECGHGGLFTRNTYLGWLSLLLLVAGLLGVFSLLYSLFKKKKRITTNPV